jgi:RHS repeat-associated protein
VTNSVSTYSVGGSIYLRTNVFSYDAAETDLLTVTNAIGVQVSSNSYNAYHQVTTNFNALGEKTRYTYDSNHELTSVTKPSGLVTTNVYDAKGLLSSTYDYAIVGGTPVYYRTNSYTYTNDLVLTHTDERGLTTSYGYDNLQRTTNVSDSRGAISYTYDKLDLVKVVDRMGFTNTFGYDSMRRKITETNALGFHTTYGYCTCGSLDWIQDAAGSYTLFYYDNQGRLLNTVNPDWFSTTNQYNLLGQLTNVTDNAGTSTTNRFNNQGLMVASSNAYGQLQGAIYDALDRVTNSTDARGVTLVSTFDSLDRPRTRIYPDSGVESIGYSANIAPQTSYTNQLNNVTGYVYDPLNRKTTEVNANVEVTQFGYSPAGDLLTLTDGKSQTTTWHYDEFGRATNKLDQAGAVIFIYQYDADDRLTNRWTPQKGNTGYGFDAVGNLLTVTYPVSPGLTMAYDMLNRMTNMVDGVGTTKRTYDLVGQLLTEDGPFASNTITNVYVNRLRTSLALQQPADRWTNGFSYDQAKRLTNVTSAAGSFGYSYTAHPSTLVSILRLPNTSYIENTFDSVARLTTTSLKNSGNTTLDSSSYLYDQANERTNLTRADATTVAFRYDKIGQLKIADGSDNNEDRGYTYDAAWNLNYRTNYGTPGAFVVNSLNELTNALSATLSYDLNGNLTNHAGHIFTYDDENRLTAWSQGMPTIGALGTTFAYDGLGRLRSRGEFVGDGSQYVLQSVVNYLYDGKRVIQERDGNNNPVICYTRGLDLSGTLEGAGGIGGLLARTVEPYCTNTSLTVTITNSTSIDWVFWLWDAAGSTNVDGVEIGYGTAQDFMFTATGGMGYTIYGTDSHYHALSVLDNFTAMLDHHRMENGPELEIHSASESGAPLCWVPRHDYYFADGNGNVIALVDTDQTLSASYRYDPFGNTIAKTGVLADANIYRFSSKELHAASGMYYYLYRFYEPGLQRWINRDPIGELGGRNLYRVVRNSPMNRFDPWGHSPPHASIGEKIACVKDCGFAKARQGAALADAAAKETRKRYPDGKGEDDYADAFRHCYWACKMERALGADCAEKILENHENAGDRAGQKELSGEMDRQNNAVGLNLGEAKGDCGDLCKQALNNGTLVKSPEQAE